MLANYFVGFAGSSTGYTLEQVVDIGISFSTLGAILVLFGVLVFVLSKR